MLGWTQPQTRRVAGPRNRGQPITTPLKRIRRQLHPLPTRPREHRRPIQIDTSHEQLPGRRPEPFQATVITAQRGNHHRISGICTTVHQSFFDTGQQHRMRAGLDEHRVAMLDGTTHRLLELHRLPNTAIPILAIQPGGID